MLQQYGLRDDAARDATVALIGSVESACDSLLERRGGTGSHTSRFPTARSASWRLSLPILRDRLVSAPAYRKRVHESRLRRTLGFVVATGGPRGQTDRRNCADRPIGVDQLQQSAGSGAAIFGGPDRPRRHARQPSRNNAEPTIDHVVAWFAIAWAGGIEVPINTDFKGTYLEHVIRESGAATVVMDARWVDRLDACDLPDLRHVVAFGDGEPTDPVDLALHRFADLESYDPAALVDRSDSDLAYIPYTSGTTGPSKGAVHSGRSALWTAKVWHTMFDITSDDVGYSMLPLFHVTARSAPTTANMWGGGSAVLRDRFTASGFWDDVRATAATNFMYMGAVVHLLWMQPERPDDRDHRLRMGGGAAAPPHLVTLFRDRFGVDLVETYGMTEIGTTSGLRRGIPQVPGTMRKPFDHLQVEIHDESDRSVAVGTSGEIVVRPNVPDAITRGYWHQPDQTLEAFRNLWFHTGDRGRLTEEGDLVFIDRIKDSLRRRGENISSEVERSVQAHPSVLECAAYAVASELTEDEIMIAVVLLPDQTIEPAELFLYCVENMPRFAVPRYVRFVDELPKTPTNRVQKHILRAEGVAGATADREALGIVVPRS